MYRQTGGVLAPQETTHGPVLLLPIPRGDRRVERPSILKSILPPISRQAYWNRRWLLVSNSGSINGAGSSLSVLQGRMASGALPGSKCPERPGCSQESHANPNGRAKGCRRHYSTSQLFLGPSLVGRQHRLTSTALPYEGDSPQTVWGQASGRSGLRLAQAI